MKTTEVTANMSMTAAKIEGPFTGPYAEEPNNLHNKLNALPVKFVANYPAPETSSNPLRSLRGLPNISENTEYLLAGLAELAEISNEIKEYRQKAFDIELETIKPIDEFYESTQYIAKIENMCKIKGEAIEAEEIAAQMSYRVAEVAKIIAKAAKISEISAKEVENMGFSNASLDSYQTKEEVEIGDIKIRIAKNYITQGYMLEIDYTHKCNGGCGGGKLKIEIK